MASPQARLSVFCAFLALVLDACTDRNYSGPALPSQSVATIMPITTRGFPGDISSVISIDGKTLGLMDALIEVLPGEHTAVVYSYENSILCGYFGCVKMHETESTVHFTAKAGRTYRIPSVYKCGQHWIWVEDSGVVIEGAKAPESCDTSP